MNDRVRLAWWNTHLSPPAGDPLGATDRQLAFETIIELVAKSEIVALGEVSSDDLTTLKSLLVGTSYQVHDFTSGGTRHKFNTGLVVNESQVHVGVATHSVSSYGTKNYRICVSCEVILTQGLELTLFLVHWPSRLWLVENSADRDHFGHSLRAHVDERRKQGRESVVILGDFNDEPFNTPLTTHLKASRDAKFVASKSELFYNPFWRSIVCPKGYVRGDFDPTDTGTYLHLADKIHRWRVFDQMIFSSNFLGASDWHLEEDETGVVRAPKLVEAVTSRRSALDHLPIVAELRRYP